MDCFEDIIKSNNNFDKTLNTTISRFNKTNDSKIVITESPNLAASYEIKEGLTPKKSWSFPQLNRLAFPLITAKESDGIEYVFAVQEPNSLTKWSFGHQRLEKHFFNTKIIGLFGSHIDGKDNKLLQPIVIYENGFCQSIPNAVKTKTEENKPNIISEDESIEFIDGLVDTQFRDNLIIYLITKSMTSSDNNIKSIYKLSVCLETYAIVKNERQSVVNKLYNWTLSHKSKTILSVNRFKGESIVFSLNGETERQLFKPFFSSIEMVYSLGATTAGSVCLIGKTNDQNYGIELWESIYGTQLGRIALPYEPFINDCKVIENTIFITCSKGLVLVPIKIQSISLSQIVGKNKVKELVLDSDYNKQLDQICNELDSKSVQSFDKINESFEDIIREISGNIPEDQILRLLIICSQKLRQTDSQTLKLFFEKLVSLPFNELFMISRLKTSKLKFQQILWILETLIELLPSNNSAIIDWISILIDSHMNLFIMNPSEDTIKVIEKIQIKIDNFCEICEYLGQIKTIFEIILSKNVNKRVATNVTGIPLPQKGQYCIEILKFETN